MDKESTSDVAAVPPEVPKKKRRFRPARQIQFNRELLEIQRLLCSGLSAARVAHYIMEKRDCHRSKAYRLIGLARREFAERLEPERDQLAADAAAQFDTAAERAMAARRPIVLSKGAGKDRVQWTEQVDDPDLDAYIRAVDAKAKLLGLHRPAQGQQILALVRGVLEKVALIFDDPEIPAEVRALARRKLDAIIGSETARTIPVDVVEVNGLEA